MSDTNNHLKDLTKEWNEVPNWTVLKAWKDGNNFYHTIYKDSGEVFTYLSKRRKDKKGYIFNLEEVSN